MSASVPPPEVQAASASPMPPGVTDPNYHPLPGRLGNLTVTMQHALEKFKKELIEEGHFVEERMDDAFLLRYVWSLPLSVDRLAERSDSLSQQIFTSKEI